MATSTSSNPAAPATTGTGTSTRTADELNLPTTRFLQSRIETLRNALISRLENIFATSMDDLPSGDGEETSEGGPAATAPPLTETATRQLTLHLETTALIRAAEEVLVLSRSMKEMWLFGGLNTIRTDEGSEEEERERLKQKESEVVNGLIEFLARSDAVDGVGDEKGGENESVKTEKEDVEMG